MISLITRTVDYSIHSLFGFDIHKISLETHYVHEPSLTLISELFTEAEPMLVLSKKDIKVKNDRNNPSIEKIAQDVEATLFEHNHDVTIHTAKVYTVDEKLKGLIASGEYIKLNNKYVFLENPSSTFSSDIYDCIFDLQLKNHAPVLIYPEKNPYLTGKYPRIMRLKDRGCLFQIDLLSLTGYFGTEAKKLASRLVENRLVRFVSFNIKDLALIKRYNGIRIPKRTARHLDEQLFVG